MADELEIINNPTSTPAAVSTGYQAQNVRSLAASNGIDKSYVATTSATNIRLYQSGAVDVSGTLYFIGTQADFTVSSAGRYFIYLADGSDADHKTPTIGTDAGTFDPELNARYLSTGERVLNWLIVKESYGSTKLTVLKMVDPGKLSSRNEPLLLLRTEITSAGTTNWTAPRSQVYTFELQACGGDGGDGFFEFAATSIASGGGGGGYSKRSEFVEAGTVLTLTRTVSSSANNTVTGTDFATITSENGTDGLVPVAGNYQRDGGDGGVGETLNGEKGGVTSIYGSSTYTGQDKYGSFGGSSFYGFGNKNWIVTVLTWSNPETYLNGNGYGGGGAGSYGGTNGTGAPGLFMIWG